MSIVESNQYIKKIVQFGGMMHSAYKVIFFIVIPICSVIFLLFFLFLSGDRGGGETARETNRIIEIGNGAGSMLEVMRTPNGGTIIQCGNELVNVSEDGEISYSKPGYSYNGQEE